MVTYVVGHSSEPDRDDVTFVPANVEVRLHSAPGSFISDQRVLQILAWPDDPPEPAHVYRGRAPARSDVDDRIPDLELQRNSPREAAACYQVFPEATGCRLIVIGADRDNLRLCGNRTGDSPCDRTIGHHCDGLFGTTTDSVIVLLVCTGSEDDDDDFLQELKDVRDELAVRGIGSDQVLQGASAATYAVVMDKEIGFQQAVLSAARLAEDKGVIAARALCRSRELQESMDHEFAQHGKQLRNAIYRKFAEDPRLHAVLGEADRLVKVFTSDLSSGRVPQAREFWLSRSDLEREYLLRLPRAAQITRLDGIGDDVARRVLEERGTLGLYSWAIANSRITSPKYGYKLPFDITTVTDGQVSAGYARAQDQVARFCAADHDGRISDWLALSEHERLEMRTIVGAQGRSSDAALWIVDLHAALDRATTTAANVGPLALYAHSKDASEARWVAAYGSDLRGELVEARKFVEDMLAHPKRRAEGLRGLSAEEREAAGRLSEELAEWDFEVDTTVVHARFVLQKQGDFHLYAYFRDHPDARWDEIRAAHPAIADSLGATEKYIHWYENASPAEALDAWRTLDSQTRSVLIRTAPKLGRVEICRQNIDSAHALLDAWGRTHWFTAVRILAYCRRHGDEFLAICGEDATLGPRIRDAESWIATMNAADEAARYAAWLEIWPGLSSAERQDLEVVFPVSTAWVEAAAARSREPQSLSMEDIGGFRTVNLEILQDALLDGDEPVECFQNPQGHLIVSPMDHVAHDAEAVGRFVRSGYWTFDLRRLGEGTFSAAPQSGDCPGNFQDLLAQALNDLCGGEAVVVEIARD